MFILFTLPLSHINRCDNTPNPNPSVSVSSSALAAVVPEATADLLSLVAPPCLVLSPLFLLLPCLQSPPPAQPLFFPTLRGKLANAIHLPVALPSWPFFSPPSQAAPNGIYSYSRLTR